MAAVVVVTKGRQGCVSTEPRLVPRVKIGGAQGGVAEAQSPGTGLGWQGPGRAGRSAGPGSACSAGAVVDGWGGVVAKVLVSRGR